MNRVVSMTLRYFDGKVPARGALSAEDKKILELIRTMPETVGALHEAVHLREAVSMTLESARAGNLYLQEQQPWKLMKENPERCGTVLNVSLEVCRALAVLFHPITPFTSEKIWRMLSLPGCVEDQEWDQAGIPVLEPGHALGEPVILFRKFEDAEIQKQLNKLNVSKPSEEQDSGIAPFLDQQVTYDEVAKLDLRVADVLEAERVKKTEKLLKLKIRVGKEERTIVAGVAQYYAPEDLVGKQIIVVANLEPAKIRGIESKGMLLAANDEERLTLMMPAQPCKSGARVL